MKQRTLTLLFVFCTYNSLAMNSVPTLEEKPESPIIRTLHRLSPSRNQNMKFYTVSDQNPEKTLTTGEKHKLSKKDYRASIHLGCHPLFSTQAKAYGIGTTESLNKTTIDIVPLHDFYEVPLQTEQPKRIICKHDLTKKRLIVQNNETFFIAQYKDYVPEWESLKCSLKLLENGDGNSDIFLKIKIPFKSTPK